MAVYWLISVLLQVIPRVLTLTPSQVNQLCFEDKQWSSNAVQCPKETEFQEPTEESHFLLSRQGTCLWLGPRSTCDPDIPLPAKVDSSCCAILVAFKPSCDVTSYPTNLPGCGPPSKQRLFYDCRNGEILRCGSTETKTLDMHHNAMFTRTHSVLQTGDNDISGRDVQQDHGNVTSRPKRGTSSSWVMFAVGLALLLASASFLLIWKRELIRKWTRKRLIDGWWKTSIHRERTSPEAQSNISAQNRQETGGKIKTGGKDRTGSPKAPPRKRKAPKRPRSLRDVEGEDLSEGEAEYIQPRENVPKGLDKGTEELHDPCCVYVGKELGEKEMGSPGDNFVVCSALYGVENTPITDL